MSELSAVALVGDIPSNGWPVEAESTEEAKAIVHGKVPRVRECVRADLMVWTANRYRQHFLLGDDFEPEWTRLANAGALDA